MRPRDNKEADRMFHDRSGGPDRQAAMDQYRRRASVYDLELLLFEPRLTRVIFAGKR